MTHSKPVKLILYFLFGLSLILSSAGHDCLQCKIALHLHKKKKYSVAYLGCTLMQIKCKNGNN